MISDDICLPTFDMPSSLPSSGDLLVTTASTRLDRGVMTKVFDLLLAVPLAEFMVLFYSKRSKHHQIPELVKSEAQT